MQPDGPKEQSKSEEASHAALIVSTKRNLRRRSAPFPITVEVVPPGTLAPNPHNPYSGLSTEERTALLIESLARIVSRHIQSMSSVELEPNQVLRAFLDVDNSAGQAGDDES